MRLALGGGAALALAPNRLRAASNAPNLHAKPLIMLDPGHGGMDPGATAPDGAEEKYITLYEARALRQMLEATGRYRVAMTRTSDIYVPLPDRVNDAMAQKASLFLSLHCDHLPTPDLRGASVFTLSDNASDALAAAVAQDENGVPGLGGMPLNGASPQVVDILASLETRATKISSQSLAHDLQASFSGVVPMLPDPHRAANFAVLRDPSTPAALLEMGCLTNPLDEARLRTPARRKMMAQRITLAINMYFDNDAAQRMAG